MNQPAPATRPFRPHPTVAVPGRSAPRRPAVPGPHPPARHAARPFREARTVAFGGPHGDPRSVSGPVPDFGGRHRPAPVGRVRVVPPPALPFPAEPAPSASAPKPKRRVGAWITVVVLLGALGAGGWYLSRTAPVMANVGDCVTQTGEDTVSAVACGEANAEFTVAGKVENRTQADAGTTACAAFPTATTSYWEGDDGEPGLVLCLAPVKR